MIATARAEVHDVPAAPAPRTDRVTAVLLALFVGGLAASITVAQGTLLLLAAWVIIRRRHMPPMRWPLLGVVVAFAAWTLVAALASDDPAGSVRSARSLLWLGTPYVLLAALPDTGAARRFLTALLVAVTAASVVAVVQVLGCPPAPQELPEPLAEMFRRCDRARGFFSIYMTLAGVLMLVLVAVLPSLLGWPGRRVAFLGAWLLGATALALTFVRGAWLGFGLGVGVAILGGRRRAVTLAAVSVGAALLLVLLPGVLERVRTIGDLQDPTTRERLAMLEAGVRLVEERPILGIGPGQVRSVYPQYAPDYAVRRSTSHLHSSPMQIAVERGLPGLALWLGIFLGFLVRAVRILCALPASHRDARALVLGAAAAVAGFLVAGLFEDNFGDSEVLLVAASVMALTFVVERDLEKA